jgi:BMFP domain-containing protein YqiC
MVQTTGRLYDEFAKLINDVTGVAQGVRREFDTVLRAQAERILGDLEVVHREELEAVTEMARLAREENESLKASIAALEVKLGMPPEELVAVTETARLAREENEALRASVAVVEAKLAAPPEGLAAVTETARLAREEAEVLKAQIATLEAKLAALPEENEALKARIAALEAKIATPPEGLTAVTETARLAREENDALKVRIAALEAKLAGPPEGAAAVVADTVVPVPVLVPEQSEAPKPATPPAESAGSEATTAKQE